MKTKELLFLRVLIFDAVVVGGGFVLFVCFLGFFLFFMRSGGGGGNFLCLRYSLCFANFLFDKVIVHGKATDFNN